MGTMAILHHFKNALAPRAGNTDSVGSLPVPPPVPATATLENSWRLGGSLPQVQLE